MALGHVVPPHPPLLRQEEEELLPWSLRRADAELGCSLGVTFADTVNAGAVTARSEQTRPCRGCLARSHPSPAKVSPLPSRDPEKPSVSPELLLLEFPGPDHGALAEKGEAEPAGTRPKRQEAQAPGQQPPLPHQPRTLGSEAQHPGERQHWFSGSKGWDEPSEEWGGGHSPTALELRAEPWDTLAGPGGAVGRNWGLGRGGGLSPACWGRARTRGASADSSSQAQSTQIQWKTRVHTPSFLNIFY